MVLWRLIRPPRTDTQKRCPFHYRGLECQSMSQEIPGVTGKFDLRVQNGAGQKANREPQSQKTNQTVHGPQPCLTLWNHEPCRVGPPKMDGSWWRVLLKRGPLEKGMANRFSILALRTREQYEKAKRYDTERYTWTSSDGQYQNQIDYILCSQRCRLSIQSAKTRPGADCGFFIFIFIFIYLYSLQPKM